MRIRSARVTSAVASTRTLRDRTRRLGAMRETVSGGESMVQLSTEVSGLSPECRKKLLDELFSTGKFTIQIPPAESLALKCDLQLPWSKLRQMRRYACFITARG